ncbi:3'-5' exonuclease [Hydrogenovibrio marinus]|uniref:DNA polymerase III subunit epsilon n=1 Tax=Hydrogenovibrio marinus TaxID=28885 RepID=A0A066ZWT8_HYDMR|nr:3'-5' exonuclease [Hydrogenovibrio marinus]KDN96714.1 DNA polymerase III subunit epsilon [Hydrogenovibrio marinus]BBN58951.1 DNA polymerase III subunit epsilon [Hydrogenovibrio marinus]
MQQNHSTSDLELIAQQLDQSEDYQVLRRFQPVSCYHSDRGETLHNVCIIDTETTGLDTERCEIIELGYQILSFDSHGQFYEVLCAKNFLNEPKGVITPEVTQVTGLTMDDVKGHQIPWDEVVADMQEVQLIVAHNAGFDRPVVERYNDVFIDKVWGCSASQVDWFNLAKVSSRSQEFLCWKVGQFFYHAHRALDDVQALTHLLTRQISEQQLPAFHFLLNVVRQQKVMMKATGAPFELKDDLRSRGYRWNASERVWQKVFDASHQESELAWLIDNNTPNPTPIKLKATDTFSIRAR